MAGEIKVSPLLHIVNGTGVTDEREVWGYKLKGT
nr:MAG TPA: hypothetical protein [Caudoviricetes sp.]